MLLMRCRSAGMLGAYAASRSDDHAAALQETPVAGYGSSSPVGQEDAGPQRVRPSGQRGAEGYVLEKAWERVMLLFYSYCYYLFFFRFTCEIRI